MPKPCKQPNKIRNPATGKCVSKTGPTGKKILAAKRTKTPKRKPSVKKACPSDKVMNPATGRCVSKSGPTGKKILASKSSKGRKPKVTKPKSPKVTKVSKPTPKSPLIPNSKNSRYYDVKEGVMKYKELRPRDVENNKSVLNSYTRYYVSQKYDGWQAVWNGKDKFTTNTGKRTFKPPKEWSKLLPQGISIAGELVILGKQAAEVASLTTQRGEWKKVRFMAFDIPGMRNRPFSERTAELKRIVKQQCKQFPTCPMVYVDQTIYSSGDQIYKKWKSVLNSGGEGLVLTDPTSLYRPMKRTNDRVKLKGREDTEGTIQGFNTSDNKLRSLKLKLKNGQTFNLGIGFSNEEREKYQRMFKLGDHVKFSYRSLSSDGRPKEARFVGKRHKADILN